MSVTKLCYYSAPADSDLYLQRSVSAHQLAAAAIYSVSKCTVSVAPH
jgi:hypothetical protein